MANTLASLPGILMLHSIYLILQSRLLAFVWVLRKSIPWAKLGVIDVSNLLGSC